MVITQVTRFGGLGKFNPLNHTMRLLFILPIISALSASAQPGTLDMSFGADGFAITDVNGGIDVIEALAVQPDGKILGAGNSYALGPGTSAMTLVRYTHDGILDAGFGNNGILQVATGGSYAVAFSVSVLNDGRILLAGASDQQMVVARCMADGSPDASFAGDGVLVLNTGVAGEAYDMRVQADGRVVLAGVINPGSGPQVGLVRLLADGSYDTSFDGDGISTTDIAGSEFERAYGLALQADGGLVVCGSTGAAETDQGVCVLRYTADGALDASFSGDGIFTQVVGLGLEQLAAVAVQPDGKVLAAGGSQNTKANVFTLLRLNADGTPDASFGDQGITYASPGVDGIARDLLLLSDGRIVAGGPALTSGGQTDMALALFTAEGQVDPAFNGGSVTTAVPGNFGDLRALALDAEGNILAAGSCAPLVPNNDMLVVRYFEGTAGLAESGAGAVPLLVMPNPTVDRATVLIPHEVSGSVRVLVRDASGHLVRDVQMVTTADGGRCVLDLGGLGPGLYSVELRSGEDVFRARLEKI